MINRCPTFAVFHADRSERCEVVMSCSSVQGKRQRSNDDSLKACSRLNHGQFNLSSTTDATWPTVVKERAHEVVKEAKPTGLSA